MQQIECTVILQPFAVESRAFTQMLRKSHRLPENTKFVAVGNILTNSLDERPRPACEHDTSDS